MFGIKNLLRVPWLLIWWLLETYIVINFMTYEITRVACKLARTTMLNLKKKKLYKKYLKHHLFPRMLPSTHVTFSSSSQWPWAEMPRPTWLQPWDVHRCFFEDNEKSTCALSRIARCAGWHEFLLPWGKRMVLIVLLSVHIFSCALISAAISIISHSSTWYTV